MNLLPEINPAEFTAFLLVLVRVSILVFLVPVLGSELVPAQVKAALALVLALILTPVVGLDREAMPRTLIELAPLVLIEVFMGLALSLLIRLVLEGVQLAGQYIGYQMGLAIVNVIDPQTGTQSSVISELAYMLALLIFLALNGHHIIFKALVESFELVRPGRAAFGQTVYALVSRGAADMFVIAVKIGAPAMAVLFFAQVSMGIVAKSVPQLNILFVGMPLYICVGLFFFGLALFFFTPILMRVLAALNVSIMTLLKAM
ncbi:MAG: flagellar biosynthetic protein FliR [Thermodesulfobacteriota bacterium]